LPPLDFEKIKAEGLEVDFLKYTQEGFEAIKPEDHYRLKTYGVCAQRHEGYHMIRIRVPGGVIRADQLERIANLAECFGHGWGHLTTRGNIELHSVKIDNFLTLRDELAEVGITTRSSCGHTFRNILGCSRNGICPDQLFDVSPWIQKIHSHVFERADFYNRRLPRRLNVSFSGCATCSADAHINDIGFIAKKIQQEEKEVYGFELWVAGSLGIAPRFGHLLKEFTSFEEVIPSLESITELYCQHGERKNPAKARLKFLLENWGPEKFRTEFEKLLVEFKTKQNSLSPELAQPKLLEKATQLNKEPLGEGIYPQRQAGFYRVEFWVPLGEMKSAQMKAIAELSRKFADGKAYHTTRQNFEFHYVKKEDISALLEAMKQFGFSPENSESILNVVACPGTSFCSLAVTSAQGAANVLMKELDHLRMQQDPAFRNLQINISGCPNSCAKHQIADVGFSGGMTESGGVRRFGYQLYVGGKLNGEVRGGTQIKKGIPDDLVFPTAESVLEIFKEKKLRDEALSDFVDRIGAETLSTLLDEKLEKKRPTPMESPVVMSPRWLKKDSEGSEAMSVGVAEEWKGNASKIVTVGGDAVAVFKTPLGFRACQNICPHAGGSLGEGSVEGETLTCPLHGWQFDLKTGTCLNEPGHDIKIYEIEEKKERVYVRC
jgi:sulfite reductase beta subunit-like hemoprotein/nitrite reductase/ring-hydroxylating ferredoxin subunit